MVRNKNNHIQRVHYIDIARGIAIILMIIGHTLELGLTRKIIFSFHMPLFIIISGMFFKKRKIKEELTHLNKKLIIPYVITIIITYMLRYIIHNQEIHFLPIIQQIFFGYSNKKTFFTHIDDVWVLWFIPFLIFCKILYYGIDKITKTNDLLKGIICFCFSSMGIYLSKINIFLPWSIDIALSSMLFYYIGYLLNKYHLIGKVISNQLIYIFIVITYTSLLKLGNIELAIRKYPYGMICYITAFCGTIIIFSISQMIEILSKKLTKILSWYGQNSMYILCVHYLENKVIEYANLGINTQVTLIIAKILIITIITKIYLIIKHKLKDLIQKN